MQFIDLQKQYQELKKEIDEGIQKVLNASNYIMGAEVEQLEAQLAAYVGIRHCITCASGTDALFLALKAYGIKEGDAVFVPTFTFFASAETVSMTGATPIFLDIDPRTFHVDAADLQQTVAETVQAGRLRPRAVVAVDLFGLPCDFERINQIAEQYNLLVVEDAAQSFGGVYQGRKACALGDIAATSFFPAKPLGCYGDGGAVFTDEKAVDEYIRSMRVHGMGEEKYDNIRVGMNSRLDTIQAAVLLPKLQAFRAYELEARHRMAALYSHELAGTVQTPFIPEDCSSSYAQYSILFEKEEQRDRTQRLLKEQGIPTMTYYKKCMHRQTVYRNNPSIYRDFHHAEDISKRILNLPMHPYLEEADVIRICSEIKRMV